MASRVQAGTFGSVVAGTSKEFRDSFNISLSGTFSATVVVEKSYDRQNVANDGAATWIGVSKDSAGAAASFTAPCSVVVSEPETGVYYRLNCTVYASGSVVWRMSQ